MILVAVLHAAGRTGVASPPGLRPAVHPDPPASATWHAMMGDEPRIHQTDHFTVAYDTSEDTLRPLVARLEGTYEAIRRFCEAARLAAPLPPERLRVLLLDRYDDFAAYLSHIGMQDTSVAGIYDQQTNIAAFCNIDHSPQLAPVVRAIAQLEDQLRQSDPVRSGPPAAGECNEAVKDRLAALRLQRDRLAARFNQFVLQHETAHQVLFNLGVHVRNADNPPWLAEGLACLFELPEADEAGPITLINQLRLADFRDALGVPPEARHVTEQACGAAFTERRLIPLADFVADSGAFAGPDAQLAFRYAQAWALVYYLRHDRGDAFAAYLHRLAGRKPGDPGGPRRETEEFRAAFGEPDEAWQGAWIEWTLRLPFDGREAGR